MNNKAPQEFIPSIARIDGNSCFVESVTDAFEIGKILFRFCEYDPQKGNKMKYTIDVYFDYLEFLSLWALASSSELDGRLANAPEGYKKLGGTSAAKLAAQGRPREDKACESRVFTITKSSKKWGLLTAAKGSGKENERKLIVPTFGKNPDAKINIPIEKEDFIAFLEITKTFYQAYLTAKAVREPDKMFALRGVKASYVEPTPVVEPTPAVETEESHETAETLSQDAAPKGNADSIEVKLINPFVESENPREALSAEALIDGVNGLVTVSNPAINAIAKKMANGDRNIIKKSFLSKKADAVLKLKGRMTQANGRLKLAITEVVA